MANIYDKITGGGIINRGTKVKLPIVGEAYIYGFVPIDEDDFFEFSILNDLDGPALGPACVIGNRVVFSIDGKFSRFPLFSTIRSITEEKYPIYLLYVPKLLKSPYSSHLTAYKYSMQNEKPHQNIGKVNGIKLIMEGTPYYYPQQNEFLFSCNSLLRAIANTFAVVTRRKSGDNELVVYEVFNPSEVEVID